ncbi:MAG: hypothetical protein ABIU54_14985 [Candidatus Eisenbacteria bacterium]
MRLLSDFDGVWTHPREEGLAQGVLLDELMVLWSPAQDRDETRVWLSAARQAVLAEPSRFGWAPGGRISCFADEDPFAVHSALLHYLQGRRDDDAIAARLVRSVLAQGHGSLEDFGGWCHRVSVRMLQISRGPTILPGAVRAGLDMLGGGIDIVVVSNSGTQKLVDWFAPTAVPTVVDDPSRTMPAATVRLRGNALKFVLDEHVRSPLLAGSIAVETARPHYEQVIRAELEHHQGARAVVGDLFSIDLSLPLRLRRTEPAFAGVRLFWIVRDYTPARMQSALAAFAPEVEQVSGLEEVAARLLAG